MIQQGGVLSLNHPDIDQWTGYSREILEIIWKRKAIWIQQKTSKGYGNLISMDNIKSLSVGDRVHFFYLDPSLPQHQLVPFSQELCLSDQRTWSVWWKPAGYLTQRNYFGSWGNLEDQIRECTNRDVYVVHRLDRETAGLVAVAHTVQMAAQLGNIFQQRQVHKYYLAWVKGNLEHQIGLDQKTIERKLDGKEAITGWKVLGVHGEGHAVQSLVQLIPLTGRFHQLRRHMDFLGYPMMGDPIYGRGNKNKEGLQLICYRLSFPHLKQDVTHLPDSFLRGVMWQEGK